MAIDFKELTAFTCLQEKFQYKVMPFDLTNAPITFQQLMQTVLRGLEAFSLPYIDDVIIFSTSFTDHLSHITSVLSRLAGAGLTVKQSKNAAGVSGHLTSLASMLAMANCPSQMQESLTSQTMLSRPPNLLSNHFLGSSLSILVLFPPYHNTLLS